jgi:hypothetical protein
MTWNTINSPPPSNGRYLVVVGGGSQVEIGIFTNGKWEREAGSAKHLTAYPLAVTHWMDLPSFP